MKTSWITLYLLVIVMMLILLYLTLYVTFEPYIEIGVKTRSDRQISTITATYGQASWIDYQLYDSCATRDWKKGTKLVVTNVDNGKSIVCVSRDFGPDASIFPERIIDLNREQFAQLENTKRGVINVKVYERR